MTNLNRRRLLQYGGAAAALPLLGSRAFAQDEPLKVGFMLIGTPNDNGWNLRPQIRAAEFMKEQLGDKVESTFVEKCRKARTASACCAISPSRATS